MVVFVVRLSECCRCQRCWFQGSAGRSPMLACFRGRGERPPPHPYTKEEPATEIKGGATNERTPKCHEQHPQSLASPTQWCIDWCRWVEDFRKPLMSRFNSTCSLLITANGFATRSSQASWTLLPFVYSIYPAMMPLSKTSSSSRALNARVYLVQT